MKTCPRCQKPLAVDAPDGLCPACLMKAGLGTGISVGPDSQGESGRTPFVRPSLEEVARLFPQVEILGFIGQGGMGAVYKARQKDLDRVVALKILPPGIGQDPAFAERFTREAKALAKLNHPGVVTLYEFGKVDGLFFFMMEFVDGVSLRQLLDGERISAREALAIVPQICDALQYAHDQGIVHRDIKPENILLDRQGRVKVADFGLVKLVGYEAITPGPFQPTVEGGTTLTEAGRIMGTPQYMAPEQREHPTEVDHRADIYSLGVVFYQMLTGELPGKPIEPPSRKVQVDVRLDEVVLRALEKEPARRYQQVSQVKTAVETVAHTPDAAKPANRTDNSAPRLLKGDAGFVTTPEQLATLEGQLFLWHRRSQLLLDERQLTVSRAGVFTVIPLAAIRDLSIGHYRRVMHPVGLDFISVTYDSDGQTQRLYFSPYQSWFGLPSNFNRIVTEWFNAIRTAVVAATGREPGNTPAEQLGVPSGSKALYALLLAPVVLGTLLVGRLLLRGQLVGDVAIHSLPGGLVIFFFAMLVLAVGFITFLVLRALEKKPELRYQQLSEVKTMVESISSSSSPVTATAPSPARPAATRGRLRAALVVGVLVWLSVTGTATLITWIRPESWKVVAVISCPHKSEPGRRVDDHFKFTAAMIELIRSDVILGRVIDRLQLDERSGKLDERWGKHNIGLKLTKVQAMVLLKRRLDVWSEGGTLIQVGVFGNRPEEPEEAMDIASTIAEELRAFRIEQHDSPADMLEMTLRFTPPDILLGLAVGFVPGLIAGGLVLWRGFLRRGSQASQVKTAVETIAHTPPAGLRTSSQAAPALPPTARIIGLSLLTAGLGAGLGVVFFGHSSDYQYSEYIVPAFFLACVGGIIGAIAGAAKEIASHRAPYNLRPCVRRHAVWRWAAAIAVVLIPVALLTVRLLRSAPSREESARRGATEAHYQAVKAAVEGLNRVLEVACDGEQAFIQAELDDAHELRLFVGSEALGWSARKAGSTTMTATVEASSEIKLADGSLSRGLVFWAGGVRHNIAITPDGPVPFGDVVFRPNSAITNENGTFTFADVHQTNGMLIPVLVCVRPVPFLAQLPQGTVELVALSLHPSLTNQPWWRPDGSLSSESFAGKVGELWAGGAAIDLRDKEMREIVFRIRGGTNIGSAPVLEFDEASGVWGLGFETYPETPDKPDITIVGPFACSPGMKKTNIRVRDASGLWKVEFKNVSLHLGYRTQVKVVDADGESTHSSSATPNFGPVVERVVTGILTSRTDCVLDLDADEFRSPPTGVLNRLRQLAAHNADPAQVAELPSSELYGWLKQSGGDLLCADVSNGVSLILLGAIPTRLIDPNLTFDTIQPHRVIQVVHRAPPDANEKGATGSIPVHWVRFDDQLPYKPATLVLFHTSEGNDGVLQFTGITDNRRGVTIRYKLVQAAGSTSATPSETNASKKFSLRHTLASEMADDLRQILLGRFGMEARPAPDNMQLTVTAPPEVLNRVTTFIAVNDWPKTIPRSRENAEGAVRFFFHACSIEDTDGVARMLAPGVLAELKGTNLTAHGVVGEENDAELIRQLRGDWPGKEAAVQEVIQAWNRFPLRRIRVRGEFSISFGPRYYASAEFEGAPEEWVELSFVPDRTGGTDGPLMIDTLPPWFEQMESGLGASKSPPEKPPAAECEASKSVWPEDSSTERQTQ